MRGNKGMMPVYVQSAYQFISHTDISDSELKQQLKSLYGVTSRRSSRLTLLSLLGALGIDMPARAGVYASSSFSSPENMHTIQMSVCQQKTPRPFNFINSINNALPFYIAQERQIEGPNLFIASDRIQWTQPILLALMDIQLGIVDHALVGWCHEHKPYTENDKTEGSHWLLLSKHRLNAIATISLRSGVINSQDVEPDYASYYYRSVQNMITQISQPKFESLDLNVGILNNYLQISVD